MRYVVQFESKPAAGSQLWTARPGYDITGTCEVKEDLTRKPQAMKARISCMLYSIRCCEVVGFHRALPLPFMSFAFLLFLAFLVFLVCGVLAFFSCSSLASCSFSPRNAIWMIEVAKWQ